MMPGVFIQKASFFFTRFFLKVVETAGTRDYAATLLLPPHLALIKSQTYIKKQEI